MTDSCPRPLDLVSAFLEGTGKWDAHVRACPSCAGQIRELEADRKAFLARHPFSSFWEALEKRKGARTGFRFWEFLRSSGAFRAAAAMASVAAVMFLVYHRPAPPVSKPEILTKGGADLSFYVASSGGQPERGKSGMAVPPGAGVQFVYSTGAENSQLLLIGVEADGTLSVYYPVSGTGSAAVEAGAQKKLPQALRWQPKSSFERFYAVFSKTPVPLEEVRKALAGVPVEKAAKLPLPYPQASVILYRK
jgi:hypothetical protein